MEGRARGEGLRTTLSTMCPADCWRGNATRGAQEARPGGKVSVY